jgi:hypothetical protein
VPPSQARRTISSPQHLRLSQSGRLYMPGGLTFDRPYSVLIRATQKPTATALLVSAILQCFRLMARCCRHAAVSAGVLCPPPG